MSQVPSDPSRREFLCRSSAAAASAGVATAITKSRAVANDRSNETVRIGLVGAGGRGGGAVVDSLSINDNVVLTAIADFDEAKPARLVKNLQKRFESAVDVPESRQYTGLDGYKRILDDSDVDVVLFATPPGFRPQHILDAVEAGKHVFAEKPTCVDPAGYRVCLQAHQMAADNKTSIVTGTQYRRQTNYIEAVQRIHAGQIGDVISATTRYCSRGIWFRARPDGMSDTEHQIRNWMHFIWLSGDQIAEQAVHNIDLMNWLMQGPPVSAFGGGGRFTRPETSEMWDSMAVDYDYGDGRFVSFMCRQIPGAETQNETIIYGSKGSAKIKGTNGGAFLYDDQGEEVWSMKGNIGAAYEQEHKDLVDAIRSDQPIVELAETANSSLIAVMGRMAAYSGKTVTWDFAVGESSLNLFPERIELDAPRDSSYAVPGVSPLV
ncbi:MAG: Gfo/Idh/MocA family oxidoreductase [Planctomycetota bacterium]